MQNDTTKRIIAAFNKCAFESFGMATIKKSRAEIYSQPDEPYPQTHLPVHISLNPSFDPVEHIHILCFSPFNKSEHFQKQKVLTEELQATIKVIGARFPYRWAWYNVNLGNIFFFTNFIGFTPDEWESILCKEYYDLAHSILPSYQVFGVGTVDTFFRDEETSIETEAALRDFLLATIDGVSLEISPNAIYAKPFFADKILDAGLTLKGRSPLETVTVNLCNEFYVFQEFSDVINNGKEKDIEEFICEHFQLILGSNYDRVESQIWLRFPQIDIGQKERRLDIFARNAVTHDWDLFELKKNFAIVTEERGVPNFTKIILDARRQLQNYSRILQQDEVKRKFEQEGIEYFEPTLHLVIGKKPPMETAKWRRLLADYGSEIKILTYDTILDEMRTRLRDKLNFLF